MFRSLQSEVVFNSLDSRLAIFKSLMIEVDPSSKKDRITLWTSLFDMEFAMPERYSCILLVSSLLSVLPSMRDSVSTPGKPMFNLKRGVSFKLKRSAMDRDLVFVG